MLGGKGLDRRAADIDRVQSFSVFRLQRACEAAHARTDLVHELGVRFAPALDFAGERFSGACGRTSASELVYRRISNHAVEPGNQALIAWSQARPVDEFGERVLQDVLGQLTVTDLLGEVREKGPMVLEQDLEWRSVTWHR